MKLDSLSFLKRGMRNKNAWNRFKIKEEKLAQAFLEKRDNPKNEGCLIFLIKLARLKP